MSKAGTPERIQAHKPHLAREFGVSIKVDAGEAQNSTSSYPLFGGVDEI